MMRERAGTLACLTLAGATIVKCESLEVERVGEALGLQRPRVQRDGGGGRIARPSLRRHLAVTQPAPPQVRRRVRVNDKAEGAVCSAKSEHVRAHARPTRGAPSGRGGRQASEAAMRVSMPASWRMSSWRPGWRAAAGRSTPDAPSSCGLNSWRSSGAPLLSANTTSARERTELASRGSRQSRRKPHT